MEMKYCYFILLLIFITFNANAEQCFSMFKTKNACAADYGIPIMDVQARSKLDCARSCAVNSTCNSFFYMSRTGLCKKNGDVLPAPHENCASTEVYGEKQQMSISCTSGPTPGGGPPEMWQYLYYPYFFMSEPCVISEECVNIPNSQCSFGLCQCILGRSFDWTTQSCNPGCTEYGHSYQTIYDTVMIGYTVITLEFLTEEQCLTECTNMGFGCKTAEYDIGVMACSLKSETALSQPASIEAVIGVNIYTKDCLFV